MSLANCTIFYVEKPDPLLLIQITSINQFIHVTVDNCNFSWKPGFLFSTNQKH